MNYAQLLDQAHDAAAKAVADLPDNGACGFAWVEIKANTAFAKFCAKSLKNGYTVSRLFGQTSERWYGSRSWRKGEWYFWNPGFYVGQSVDAIEAGARAFAKVLNANGIEAYAASRLD